MKPIVYLAGPIAGTLYADVVDWREQAAVYLNFRNIETLSPMRGKEALAGNGRVADTFRAYDQLGAFYTSKGIMTRDHTDVKRVDALLVNLLGATKPSLGTIMELAWAYAYGKPAVVVIEREGNVHDNHPMIHEAIGFRVETLDEGIDAVAVILGR